MFYFDATFQLDPFSTRPEKKLKICWIHVFNISSCCKKLDLVKILPLCSFIILMPLTRDALKLLLE